MPEYRHPLADDDAPGHPPARVHVSRGDKATVAEDGTFEAPRSVGESVAARFNLAESDIRVDGDGEYDAAPGEPVCTCDPGDACDACGGKCPTVKSDGEVCGRDRPCPYHDDAED